MVLQFFCVPISSVIIRSQELLTPKSSSEELEFLSFLGITGNLSGPTGPSLWCHQTSRGTSMPPLGLNEKSLCRTPGTFTFQIFPPLRQWSLDAGGHQNHLDHSTGFAPAGQRWGLIVSISNKVQMTLMLPKQGHVENHAFNGTIILQCYKSQGIFPTKPFWYCYHRAHDAHQALYRPPQLIKVGVIYPTLCVRNMMLKEGK